ncbi:MAG: aminotransferase class V-fold PLP-dependent enzyme [Pseudomonadota bacterium]
MTGLTPEEVKAFDIAHQKAVSYRQSIGDRQVPPRVGLDQAMQHFRQPLDETGQPADQLITSLADDADGALNQMSSGSFHGYVLGGSMPVGVAADMLVSAWGQNAGSAFETPAISGMERAVCDWCINLMGLPSDAGVGLVSGGSVANTVGVMAARNGLLAKQNWDVEEKGLYGAPEIPILIGDDAHSAAFAALRYAGFGSGRAIRVETDQQGRILTDAFKQALDACKAPPLVLLQAGQINTGAFDPFAELIPLVHEKGGWVHVDGAFGLWVAAVPELRSRLAGVESADSWAVDLHKWLNAPFDAGLAIVRDRAPLVSSMSARGAYLPDKTAHWEPADSTLELSRRGRGVPSYAILKHLGRKGVRELVGRHCYLAQMIADRLSEEPGLTVLNEVASNQVALTCGNEKDGNSQTQAVLRNIQARGKVYPTHGEWRGRFIIRVSVIGYATKQQHAELVIDEIVSAWREVQGSARG